MTPIKSVTIIQPYAELIAAGVKRVENRTWPTNYRGPLFIHAGKAKRYGGEPVFDIAKQYELEPASLVFGAVIAVADLIDCVELVEVDMRHYRQRPWRLPAWAEKRHAWMNDHEHTEGPVCWILANVRRLTSPAVVDGKQGLWTPKPDLIDRVSAAVAGAEVSQC
jgi:hypothetical protein